MFEIKNFSKKILNTDIKQIGLTTRTKNILIQNEIKTVHDLINAWHRGDINNYRNAGSVLIQETTDKLYELGGLKPTDKNTKLQNAKQQLKNKMAKHEQELQRLKKQLKLLDQRRDNQ